MLDSNNILELIKKSALDAVESNQPTDFCYGKVVSTNPLQINIEQRMELNRVNLVLTRNVTDYKTHITIPGEIGKVEVTVHNSLEIGDTVILIKKKGGQKYLILDRLVTI